MGVVAMYRSFDEIEDALLESAASRRLVLAGSQDDLALEAVVRGKRAGLLEAVLVGDETRTRELLAQMGEDADAYEFVPCDDERECARIAVRMVHEGYADIPMKGLMQTASFMKAVLDKEWSFVPAGGLLSQATVLEWPAENRMLVISDCAVNIAPDRSDKAKIARNAIDLAHVLGVEMPKVAMLSAVEVVKSSIPSTVDAAEIAALTWEDAVVGGPFALDNAIDAASAAHKGIDHPAAGAADVLVVPDLCSGNIFTKSLTFFARLRSAGALCGTTSPVVMTSRTDTPEDKYLSILVALLRVA